MMTGYLNDPSRLKYYRDLNNVVDTSREEGREEGRQEGLLEGKREMVLRLLSRRLGELPGPLRERVVGLELEVLEALGDKLLDFSGVDDLSRWLENRG